MVSMGSQVSVHQNPESKPTLMSPPVVKVHDIGSKEESFFDSKVWLESDCEDDFFSVNGDFTPSRRSFSSQRSSSAGNNSPLIKNTIDLKNPEGFNPVTSLTEKKKRLSELFQESPNECYDDIIISKPADLPQPEKKKLNRATPCCLPRLATSLSCNGRKKSSGTATI
ncbi:hypothetical protein GIB67_002815 [Kingdonia uniflora]|uniref:Uncharacterized protein n=1 Tax=Kingdonia uniflora TaxID=39325 RepID=A0A7J7M584_9MAGN|nr:hypothetical protein GIB67_002815 [Kingdonia uniflora]